MQSMHSPDKFKHFTCAQRLFNVSSRVIHFVYNEYQKEFRNYFLRQRKGMHDCSFKVTSRSH